MGTEYIEDTAAWDITHTQDIRKALKIGRIFAARTANDELVGLAVTFLPGKDMGDIPNEDEVKRIEEALPPSQTGFRDDVREPPSIFGDWASY
jgi:hypothetical protein